MATICLQCGDKGWDNAFVYCIECLEVGVHRYCLDQIPETLDEFVELICDFCKEEEPNQHTILKESSIPAQKMNIPSPKNAKPVEVTGWRSCDDMQSYEVDDKTKSRNDLRDGIVGFLDTAKSTGFGEDQKKSWNGRTWDDVVGSLESLKATGWEDEKKSWNGSTWDVVVGSLESLKATGGAYNSIGSMNSLDPTTADMQTDDSWARISENERKARVASGWNENAAKREKFLTSHQQNGNGRSCDDEWCYNMDDKKKSRNCQWDATAGFLDTSKSMGQREDEKKSYSGPTGNDVTGPLECVKPWNGPTLGDVTSSLERPKVTGWADNSIRRVNSLDPIVVDMQTDDICACSLENERKARDAEVDKWEKKVAANPEVSGRNEIVVEINSNTDELGKKYKQQQNKNHLGSMNAHVKVEENNGIKDEKVLLLLKSALVEFITEILKPACNEGQMSKENHNIIVKKVVDKVTSSIRGVYVPKTAVHVDEYMSFSKLNIFNLVNEYIKIFRNRELVA